MERKQVIVTAIESLEAVVGSGLRASSSGHSLLAVHMRARA